MRNNIRIYYGHLLSDERIENFRIQDAFAYRFRPKIGLIKLKLMGFLPFLIVPNKSQSRKSDVQYWFLCTQKTCWEQRTHFVLLWSHLEIFNKINETFSCTFC